MSGAGVAAAGVAVAMYLYSRRRGGACGPGEAGAVERFRQQTHAPSTWLEAVYYSAEAIRHVYGETLGTWRTADLLIGLAYLARRDPPGGSVLHDIATAGVPYGANLHGEERQTAKEELHLFQHCMAFGLALRQLRPARQLEVLRSQGFVENDFLVVQQRSGLLKPSYFLLRDRAINAIVLLIRGTQTVKDMFTSMTSASKPHHVVDANGVTLGYTHFGMLAAARYIRAQVMDDLRAAMAANPDMRLQLVGHSMGAGCAAILTMMLREMPEFADTTCVAVACPACMTVDLARSCAGYVTTIINDADMVPTMSLAGMDGLRAEVMESAWAADFRADVRSTTVVRAVEGSLSRVGGGLSTVAMSTAAATNWTTRQLRQGLRACSWRRSDAARPKKRKSEGNLVDLEEWAHSEQAARLRRGLHPDPGAPPLGKRRSSSGGGPVATEGASSGGLVYGALTACTGRRRKPHKAAAVTPSPAKEPVGHAESIEHASDWIDVDEASDDVRVWGSVMAAFQAWGWRSEPPTLPRSSPGILSSVAAAPVAAVSYLTQWVPSLGLARPRTSLATPRSPLSIRTRPDAGSPRGSAPGLLSRMWRSSACPLAAQDAVEELAGPSTPPAGGSPRATAAPLWRATSEPALEGGSPSLSPEPATSGQSMDIAHPAPSPFGRHQHPSGEACFRTASAQTASGHTGSGHTGGSGLTTTSGSDGRGGISGGGVRGSSGGNGC
eukprot:CAMPEP_0206152198 /NCGR_PEP_ID=MMETSP1473-20131121/39206_1 /ASSEMBLY_ACC=CAM_ASM_001109 /TAXON_ID=1461547 /ORGANISM="Stichococcus sp, Strain RCC1054" /LENGTH=723 /DNA_ID=CAMNT_0053549757 /DNA_START=675 /DNA_END=2843 /DNA_ORIENTATION=+